MSRRKKPETKKERDKRVYLSLLNGGTLAQAASTGGISVSTIHRRGIKERADRKRAELQASREGRA